MKEYTTYIQGTSKPERNFVMGFVILRQKKRKIQISQEDVSSKYKI